MHVLNRAYLYQSPVNKAINLCTVPTYKIWQWNSELEEHRSKCMRFSGIIPTQVIRVTSILAIKVFWINTGHRKRNIQYWQLCCMWGIVLNIQMYRGRLVLRWALHMPRKPHVHAGPWDLPGWLNSLNDLQHYWDKSWKSVFNTVRCSPPPLPIHFQFQNKEPKELRSQINHH